MKVYMVTDPYWNDEDDKWEEVMGDKQIREFALMQLCNKAEDFIFDNNDKEIAKKIKIIWNKIDNNCSYFNFTIDEINTIFKAFNFEYKELNIY